MHRSLTPVFAATLLALTAWPAAAQPTGCDIVSADAVSQAVGWTVTLGDTPSSSVTSCFFDDDSPGIDHVVTVSLKRGAFDAGGAASPAVLASQMISIPAEYHGEIDALHEVGVPVQIPEYSVSLASGAGDGAVWIAQTGGGLGPDYYRDALVVQRGTDAYSFGVADGPEALTHAMAVAHAALASAE